MAPSDAKSLLDLIDTTLALLTQFRAVQHDTSSSTNPTTTETPPNPLALLRDASKLTKAHVTKLSLLAINKPFTPSAIRKVLQELTSTCLPALMSGAQICSHQRSTWGDLMVKEVDRRVQSIMEELETFLKELQSIARSSGTTSNTGGNRDSLSSTGVVWQHCDNLIALETLGVAGLAVQKASNYRDMIKDAIEELEEWKNGEDLDTEGKDALLDPDDEGVDGDEFEDMFHAANSMPKDRPEFAALVEEAVAKLKKVVLLYNAVEKRRLKTFRVGGREGSVERLNQTLEVLASIPHHVDDLAGTFYELDEDAARKGLTKLLTKAKDVASSVRLTWGNEEDPFTQWSTKWTEVVG